MWWLVAVVIFGCEAFQNVSGIARVAKSSDESLCDLGT